MSGCSISERVRFVCSPCNDINDRVQCAEELMDFNDWLTEDEEEHIALFIIRHHTQRETEEEAM